MTKKIKKFYVKCTNAMENESAIADMCIKEYGISRKSVEIMNFKARFFRKALFEVKNNPLKSFVFGEYGVKLVRLTSCRPGFLTSALSRILIPISESLKALLGLFLRVSSDSSERFMRIVFVFFQKTSQSKKTHQILHKVRFCKLYLSFFGFLRYFFT